MEYQAKELFAKHDVPVTLGAVVEKAEDAAAAAESLGGRVVVKAQVKTGGRGKAGGIKLANNPDEAEQRASEILGMDIKGYKVRRVLVDQQAPGIKQEIYLAVLIDRAARRNSGNVNGAIDIGVITDDINYHGCTFVHRAAVVVCYVHGGGGRDVTRTHNADPLYAGEPSTFGLIVATTGARVPVAPTVTLSSNVGWRFSPRYSDVPPRVTPW